MHLELTRKKMDTMCTEGSLTISGVPYSATLENPQRKVKIWGKTAIPAGTYPLSVVFSPHFGRKVVQIDNIAAFSCVYLHDGMTAKDTDGCVIIADKEIALDEIGGNSRKLMDNLTSTVITALARGEHCDITINALSAYL